MDPAKGLIDAMLMLDLTAPRKQRHTARRVLARLVDEHELTDLTYSAVRDYVAKRWPEIWAAAGKGLEDAFVPQSHEPGAEGEVDFADLWIDLAGGPHEGLLVHDAAVVLCSPACRQAAYRRRQAQVTESSPAQLSGGRGRGLNPATAPGGARSNHHPGASSG